MSSGNDVRLSPQQWCLVQTLLLEGALRWHGNGREETAREVVDELIPSVALAAGSDVLDAATCEVRDSLGLPTDPP